MIAVRVIDVSDGRVREDIQSAQRRFSNFTFERLSNKTRENCTGNDGPSDRDSSLPPCSVRQQTRDVTAALQQCSHKADDKGWVAIVEDDTEICPSALRSMAPLLRAMSQEMVESPGAWRLALFATYFSGASFPKSAIPAFLRHAREGLHSSPIDHLALGDWAKGATFHYQGNLYRHRGWYSTFAYRNERQFHFLHDHFRFSVNQVGCELHPPDAVRHIALKQGLNLSRPLDGATLKPPRP